MKRFLSGMISLLLAAFLAVMLLPGSGANADIVESGTCGADGDNITWALDSEGILTIQGSGKMKDWNNYNDYSPWYKCADVKTVVIGKGVTSIGNGAFAWCEKLESITIPDSITSIGNYAFLYCTELKEITIPDSVTSIGNDAFTGCSGLKEITIPDSVTSIGNWAFFGCSELKEITIPDSVTSIGLEAFEDCRSLKKIVFPDKESYAFDQSCFAGCTDIETVIVNSKAELNPVVFSDCPSSFEFYYYYDVIYSAENGTVEGKSRSYAGDILELDITPDENYIVDKVTLNGNEILSDENGKYICTMPDSEDSVTIEATFMPGGKCGENVTWKFDSEGTLTISGNGKMEDWNYTSDPSPWYRWRADVKTVVIGKDVTSIGNAAFTSCENLESITIPESVTSIGNDAFNHCSGLKEITIPDSVTSIGEGAFTYCENLKSITIPDSVTSIGTLAFYYCSELKEITIPDSVTSIGEYAFAYCENLKSITIPDSVTSIGNKAFYYCTELKEITIPDSVTSIGEYAFAYCENLKSITIPDSVTSIGRYAFRSCFFLTKIILPNRSDLIVKETAFNSCKNINFVVLNSGTDINPNTFPNVPEECIHYYYDVEYSTDDNGVVKGKTRSYLGDSLELDVTPDANYIVDTVTLNGEKILPDENGKYICTMPDSEDAVKFNVSFKLKQKEVTFCIKDGDKAIELQKSNVDMTTVPAYAGSDPTKDPDDQFTYTFTGWTDGNSTYDKDEALPEVTDDVTYYAVFEPTTNSYEISFVDENGEELQSDRLKYGETPVFKGTEPSKAEDDTYTYTFAGWTPEITKVTGDATYSPVFTSKEKQADIDPEVKASFEAFVERMYVVVLDRPSEPEGKTYWTDKVINGELTGADCARNFLNGQEFKDRNLSDEEFVTVLYKAFFDRDAKDDPDGFNFWMESLKVTGRENIIEGFISSPEWIDLCSEYCVKPGTAKAVTGSAADFATRLYTECLGREPDEEGLKFWSQGLIDHKITGSQAAHEFFYSAEFNSLNLGNKELITRMYRTFLGRDPEDEGLTFWMDSMDKGMTKDQLFDSFVNSKEFSDICISYAIDR